MAIESFDYFKGQKLDLLFKKISGYTKSDTEIAKSASNETISSPFYMKTDFVYSEEIPGTPPTADTDVIKVFSTGNVNNDTRLELTQDPTSTPLRTWIAATNPSAGLGGTDATPAAVVDPLNIDVIKDWVPPTENALYAVQVFIENGGTFDQVFPDGSGNDDQWYFDYQGGVLHFIGENLPSQLIATSTVHINGYVYIGSTQQEENAYVRNIIDKLIPAPPEDFPNGDLVFSNVGSNPHVAAGAVPDNTNGGTVPTAGTALGNTPGATARVTAATLDSSIIDYSGPGDSGTLTAYENTVANGSITFDENDNSGIDGILEVVDNVDHGTVASYALGFWFSFRSRIQDGTPIVGFNRYSIEHDETASTGDSYVLRDNLTVSPTTTGGTLSEDTPGTLAYSSSVAHYDTGAILNLTGVNVTNLVGEAYYDADPFTVQNGSVTSGNGNLLTTETYSYAEIESAGDTFLTGGIPNRQTLDIELDILDVTLNSNNSHTTRAISWRTRNVNGQGGLVTSSELVNFMAGTNGNVVDEDRIVVTLPTPADNTPLTFGERLTVEDANDTPAYTFTGLAGDFSGIAALDVNEAAVVGGRLTHNQIDYSTGYLPAGADLSVGRSGSQYFTFLVRRKAVSKFDFTFNGKVTGLWVKLPGVSDSLSSENGWWDATVAYGGSGTPGDLAGGNGSNGCALAGNLVPGQVYNGPITVTFGQASSSAATENNILIRVKLEDTDYINTITIDEATN